MNTIEIAIRINALSKEIGSSVNKVLSECSLSKSIVDNLKKGSMPTADKLYTIAQYFNVSTDYLLTGVEHTSAQLSDDEKRMLEYYRRLDTLEKGELLGELKVKTSSRESKQADA